MKHMSKKELQTNKKEAFILFVAGYIVAFLAMTIMVVKQVYYPYVVIAAIVIFVGIANVAVNVGIAYRLVQEMHRSKK